MKNDDTEQSDGDENDVGLSVANYVGTAREPASALAVGNAPPANIDAGAVPRQSDAGMAVVKRRLPSVASLSNVERGRSGGRVRVVFCQIQAGGVFR